MSESNYEIVNNELIQILEESGITEFKWSKLRGAKYRFPAIKIIDLILDKAIKGILRFDALIWDKEDSRHNVIARDDIENLHRMYYHLFMNVLKKRWPSGNVWNLFPDENSAIDWQEIQEYLMNKNESIVPPTLFNPLYSIREDFRVEQITPVVSEKTPLCQVSDFFVGLAVFSREKFSSFIEWSTANPEMPGLFDEQHEMYLSNKDQERYPILRYLNNACKRCSLTVSLMSKNGLQTRNPAKPINFWFYQPQSLLDKAPVR